MPSLAEIEPLHGNVIRIAAEPKTAPKGGYLFRGLELSSAGDSGRVFIICPQFAGEDLYGFPLLCWEGCRIDAHSVQFNNRLEDGTLIYIATDGSELILEPHRPVSVTEAVEAASCIRATDVRYRVGPEEPFWMAKGRLIHTLFERLISRIDEPCHRTFEQAYQKALPALKAVVPGSEVFVDATSLAQEARTHFDNLQWWLEKNRELLSCAEVELDRISTRWGLKGRADAILHNPRQRTILELKTGRVPVEEHLLQLYAYSLLFRGNGPGVQSGEGTPEDSGREEFRHDESPPIDGYVLYSATGKAERLKGPLAQWRKQLLVGRNRTVALKHSYTVEQSETSHEICPRKGKCFSRTACQRVFGHPISAKGRILEGLELDYYNSWFKLLSEDAWLQEGEFARVLDPETLSERIREGVTLPIAAIREWQTQAIRKAADCPEAILEENERSGAEPFAETTSANPLSGTGGVHLELILDDLLTDIGPGEELMVHQGDPCAGEALRARVINADRGSVVVSVKAPLGRQTGDEAAMCFRFPLHRSDGWFLDRIPFARGRDIARHGLFKFLATGSREVKRVVVCGETAQDSRATGEAPPSGSMPVSPQAETPAESVRCDDSIADLCFAEGLRDELNEDQEAAVAAAMDSPTFQLIHGPPGTGKTRVLARLIRMCLDRGERVLVVCPTNVALDRLLLAALRLGVREFLRIGGRSTASEEFLKELEASGNCTALLEDLCSSPLGFAEFRKHVGKIPLVGATAYQSVAHPLLLGQRFQRVIVDEAGQLDEPSTVGPLALAPRFVLGGDHLQLPPVVKSRKQASVPGGSSPLERSLFERLVHSCAEDRISRLRVQYRMNEAVQAIPSRLFYESTLVPFPEVAGRRLNIQPGVSRDWEVNSIIDPARPVVFVDVESSDNGKASPPEAALACRIVEALIASGVSADEIGIITPYRAQQALIRRTLGARVRDLGRVVVDTVDRFQGGEKEVILLSLARSDEVTSFLADRKRLNVSLTRARSKLILLGHGPALDDHPLFSSILQGLERIRVSS
jgi:DNA replication ATP-dependent helicase Dna2